MTLTATVLHLAALCWLSSQARAEIFLQARTEGEYPTAWRRAAIPRDGIYFVSATVDGKDNTSIQSLITVKANGRILLKAFAEGLLAGTAMAFSLKAGDNITAVKSGVSAFSPRCSLTVAYVDSVNDTYFFAWTALNDLKKLTHIGSPINFQMTWISDSWRHKTPGETYFSISWSNTYWVMARFPGYVFGRPVGTVEVRSKTGRLFLISVRSNKPSSCAGAYRLKAGSKVYMTAAHSDICLHSYSLLSVLELKPPKGTSSEHTHAVTFLPRMESRRDCKALGHPLTWDTIDSLDFRHRTPQGLDLPDPTHINFASLGVILTRNISSTDKIPEGFALYISFIYQLGTGMTGGNYRKVAIELQITGVYLLSMRPVSSRTSDSMGIAMTRNGGRPVWVVISGGRQGNGDTIAYRLTHGTRLRYYLFASSSCKPWIESLVSVALAQPE